MDNKKEGPGNFSGGRSPHWVNHVYMHLYFIVYLLCFISTLLFYFIAPRPYFSKNWYPSEKRVPGLSGTNGGRWKI
jgi:hypothetical protein